MFRPLAATVPPCFFASITTFLHYFLNFRAIQARKAPFPRVPLHALAAARNLFFWLIARIGHAGINYQNIIRLFRYISKIYTRLYKIQYEMANNSYLFSLDETTAAIIKEVPKTKRSAFVREAIMLKTRSLEPETPIETPAPKSIPTVRIKI